MLKYEESSKQLMQKCNINTVLNLLRNNIGLGVLLLDQKTSSKLALKNSHKSYASEHT